MDDRDRYEAGLKVRRAVLGDAHVDKSQAKQNAFTQPFQDLITRYAWGDIWSRPGLPRHTRSLITIAMLIALNRTDELRLHLRAALNNNVTREEIQELLLHSAIYCGVPAANSSFHIAAEMFAEVDATLHTSQS
jgi:4-carboxymuconolactone decarboxylase